MAAAVSSARPSAKALANAAVIGIGVDWVVVG